jgi:hypothetical protein
MSLDHDRDLVFLQKTNEFTVIDLPAKSELIEESYLLKEGNVGI